MKSKISVSRIRTSQPANRAMANFFKVDIQAGLNFLRIALLTVNPLRRRQTIQNARKAHDAVEMLLRKGIDVGDRQVILRNLRQLRSELESLGEVF